MAAKVFLVGKLLDDIVLQKRNDKVVTNFEVQCNVAGRVEFIKCTAWGKYAETLKEKTNKGMRVVVEGEWTSKTYYDESKSTKFTNIYVTVEKVEYLDPQEKQLSFDEVDY